MKYVWILAFALVAACGKDEPANTSGTPSLTVPKTPEKPAGTTETPSVDAAKTALEKSIADTKALIEKKKTDMNALLEKVKSDPMKAATYKAEADKLQKEIDELQAKLEGYMKEAAK